MKDRIEVLPFVRKTLELRVEKGTKEYGEPLQTHNGRDALWDAFEEVLDLAMYLGQAILEQHNNEGEIEVKMNPVTEREGIVVNTSSPYVEVAGVRVRLGEMQAGVMGVLVEKCGQVVDVMELATKGMGFKEISREEANEHVKVMVFRLRRKFSRIRGIEIDTIHKIGYRLIVRPSSFDHHVSSQASCTN